jgi:hypothetical protein
LSTLEGTVVQFRAIWGSRRKRNTPCHDHKSRSTARVGKMEAVASRHWILGFALSMWWWLLSDSETERTLWWWLLTGSETELALYRTVVWLWNNVEEYGRILFMSVELFLRARGDILMGTEKWMFR